MNETQPTDPFEVPAFATFRELIVQNLGFFPEISYDRRGRKHRVRRFDQPILLSEFALGRHKRLLDLTNVAYESRSTAYLSAGLCLLLGGDWLLSNKFPGLGLVAHAFREHEFSVESVTDPVAKLLADAAQDHVGALINLFFPIAHEIGHFPAAQAYCPLEIKEQIMSEEFLKTYEIN
jgi:hypothetical protein